MASSKSRPGVPLLIRMVSTNPDVQVKHLPPRPEYLLYQVDFGRTLYLADTDDVLYVKVVRPLKSHAAAAQLTQFIRSYAPPDQLIILETSSVSPDIQFDRLIAPYPNLTVTRTSEFERALRASRWEAAVAVVLRSGISRERLNPYQFQGAVTGNRFFGRERQVQALLRRPQISHLVTGPRMSGKTSLLLEAMRRLRMYYSSKAAHEVPIAYVDCRRVSSFAGLIHDILYELRERSSFARVERWDAPERWPHFFSYLRARASKSNDRRLYLFFDEYDHVVEMEQRQGFHFTWQLRALHQSNLSERGVIQMVFAGSKHLAAAQRNQASGMHNFVNMEDCKLDNFDRNTISHALERPLHDLGFALDDSPRLVEHIFRETGGRPASVQFVCNQIVRQLLDRGHEVLTVEVLDEVVSSRQYREFYAATLRENTDTLDLFILALGTRFPSPGAGFSLGDVVAGCQGLGMRVHEALIYESLENLENAGFLVRVSHQQARDGFDFSAPVVREIATRLDPARIAEQMVLQATPGG